MIPPEHIEDLALASLVLRLRSEGASVQYMGSPDRDQRGKPAIAGSRPVDFEIEVDGSLVDVDVTTYWPEGGRQRKELERFEQLVRPELGVAVAASGIETLFCFIAYREWPAKAKAQTLADAFINAVVPHLGRVAHGEKVQVIDPWRWPGTPEGTGTILDHAFDGIELFQVQAAPNKVVTQSHDKTQTLWLGAGYVRLVADLIDGKKDQLADYADGRLVIATVTHGYLPALLRDALTDRASEIPASWRRVYFTYPGLGLEQVWP